MKSLNKTLLAISPLLLAASTLPAQAASLTTVANGLGVYDLALDATWTADANLLGTLEAGDANLISTIVLDEAAGILTAYGHTLTANDFGSGGLVNWWAAQAFVAYLNKIEYGNSSQWALPISNAVQGYNQTDSQLGELFYNELGGTDNSSIPASAFFTNEQSHRYWSGNEYSASHDYAWHFITSYKGGGLQDYILKDYQFYAWAVSPGNIEAAANSVPEPGMLALMLTGLGLLVVKRRVHAG